MAMTDGCLYIHGTGSSAFGAISYASGIYGDSLCRAGAAYSALELDLGAPGSASSWPYVSQFPSLTEKGYSASGYTQAEAIGAGGVPWGLHIQVMSAFNTLTNIVFYVCSAATTAATYSANEIARRTLTLAQLAIVGAHYIIPVNPTQVLEFNRFYADDSAGSNPTLGTIIAWFGPRTGDEL